MTVPEIKASDGIAPSELDVKEELLAFWDGYSPFSMGALRQAYEKERTLEDIGLDDREARACATKYNSLIFRGPGRGPLTTAGEAEKWLENAMPEIVKIVFERSQLR